MLTDNKEDFNDEIFKILPDFYDENGAFYLTQVVSKVYENIYGSYEEDYLDINDSVGVMKDYFIEKELFNIISLPQQPIKMQLNAKSKRILNFKDPKREVFYLGEIKDISIDVFDNSNNYILNTQWNLSKCLDNKHTDIKYTAELLEKINRFLLQEDLLLEISPEETKRHDYYLTDKGKEIKQIGTYAQYKKSIKDEKKQNLELIKKPIRIAWWAFVLSFVSFVVPFCLDNDKDDEIEGLKNDINVINSRFEELKTKQLELEKIKYKKDSISISNKNTL